MNIKKRVLIPDLPSSLYMTGSKLTFTSCEKENKQNNNNDD
jgi:hypothetical protein